MEAEPLVKANVRLPAGLFPGGWRAGNMSEGLVVYPQYSEKVRLLKSRAFADTLNGAKKASGRTRA